MKESFINTGDDVKALGLKPESESKALATVVAMATRYHQGIAGGFEYDKMPLKEVSERRENQNDALEIVRKVGTKTAAQELEKSAFKEFAAELLVVENEEREASDHMRDELERLSYERGAMHIRRNNKMQDANILMSTLEVDLDD